MIEIINENGDYRIYPKLIKRACITTKDYKKTKKKILKILKKEKKTCAFHKSILEEIINDI